MEPGIGTGFGKRPESVPTEPGTGPGANRSPYPPDESPRADAGPSVRNPHAASLTPASAGVFRNESRPNAPQTSQKPSHPPRRRKIAPPSDPGKTHPTLGKPVRAPGSPCPPGIADPFSRTRPLRPPEKRTPAPPTASQSGPTTAPYAIPRPPQPRLRRGALRAGAIPLQRPAEKKNRRLPPRKGPLTGGESCDKIAREAKTRSAPPSHPPPAPLQPRRPPRNSASPAPENSPAAGNLSAPTASTRRNTLPCDLFRSRKRALTFADKLLLAEIRTSGNPNLRIHEKFRHRHRLLFGEGVANGH